MGLTATFSFADSIGNGDASTYATAVTSFATKRISDTKASASVLVQFTRTADEYVVAIVLQKKTSSGWVTATDVSGSAHYYRGSNKDSVTTYDTWTVKKEFSIESSVSALTNMIAGWNIHIQTTQIHFKVKGYIPSLNLFHL